MLTDNGTLAHAWLGPLVHERRGSHGRHRGRSPEMLSYGPERWFVPCGSLG